MRNGRAGDDGAPQVIEGWSNSLKTSASDGTRVQVFENRLATGKRTIKARNRDPSALHNARQPAWKALETTTESHGTFFPRPKPEAR